MNSATVAGRLYNSMVSNLLNLAVIHDSDAIAHCHRFRLVMGDVNCRRTHNWRWSLTIWARSFGSEFGVWVESGSSIKNLYVKIARPVPPAALSSRQLFR